MRPFVWLLAFIATLCLTLAAHPALFGQAASLVPGTYATQVAVTPQSAAAGSSVAITATVAAGTTSGVLVDIEVYGAGGGPKVFQQSWDNQALTAGLPQRLTANWQIPVSQASGIYTVKLGVFTPGWASQLAWTDNAGQISVTAPTAGYTTQATATPASIAAGASVSLVATVSATVPGTVLVDLEMHDPGGAKVFQQFWDNQTLSAGQPKSWTAVWQVPDSQASGNYTVQIGVFTSGWASQLAWNSSEALVVVAASLAAPTPPRLVSMSGLHVSGNQIVNSSGQAVRLLGVNRSGTEYACMQGWGFSDGPVDAASIQAIASWRVNAVRVPLNEDCWLGINGAPAAYSGANYQQAISSYVSLITGQGLAAIVDLHWSAPGTSQATGQQPMADKDHAPTFWNQVATTFKNNGAVIFELYNEPAPDNGQDTTAAWACWRDGGTCPGVSFPVAGMQELVNDVRQAGATNLVLLGGLSWSNALSQWRSFEPSDAGNNLAVAWHAYNFNACSTSTCYNRIVGPLAAGIPVVTTEIGENDCSSSFITTVMSWLDVVGQSYVGWAWDTWGTSCGANTLVSSYSGTPTAPYGQGFHDHLAALP